LIGHENVGKAAKIIFISAVLFAKWGNRVFDTTDEEAILKSKMAVFFGF